MHMIQSRQASMKGHRFARSSAILQVDLCHRFISHNSRPLELPCNVSDGLARRTASCLSARSERFLSTLKTELQHAQPSSKNASHQSLEADEENRASPQSYRPVYWRYALVGSRTLLQGQRRPPGLVAVAWLLDRRPSLTGYLQQRKIDSGLLEAVSLGFLSTSASWFASRKLALLSSTEVESSTRGLNPPPFTNLVASAPVGGLM